MQNTVLDAVDRSDFDPNWTDSEGRKMGDPWGNAMSLWFSVADYIWFETEYMTPAHWEYRAGAGRGGLDDLEEYDPWLYNALASAEIETLIRTGNVLERYTRMLDNAGRS